MAYRAPARTPTPRGPSTRVYGLLLVLAAAAVAFGFGRLATLSSTATSTFVALRTKGRGAAGGDEPSPSSTAAPPLDILPREHNGALGEADGVVPDGTTVFDDAVPAVGKLNPALLTALRRAAIDAGRQGVAFYVDSGWRSPAYQEQLLQEAIAQYGSAKEAARWVATPARSRHVSGDAVDIGSPDATAWLSKHGAKYGLCQIYRNEPWHYELRPETVGPGCPAMYADPSQDPRLQ